MKLEIKERLLLPTLLPQNGGYIEMIISRSIEDMIRLTPLEIEEYGIKELDNGSIVWNADKVKETDIYFTAEQISLLKSSADKADADKKINKQNLSLIEKIKSL